ncbi:MAG TPA: ADP-ribosylglycohydrolase family protein [Micromonosporaceae bacterium]|jgi:ADP-ribosylglycohydrolase
MSVAGSLYGLAFGDALGKPTEFRDLAEITARYGPSGPTDLPRPALVTDDTQMAIAVADGLLAALRSGSPLTAANLEPPIRDRFLDWWRSPDNNRAPGMTCLNACESMAGGVGWRDASVIGSKGCGANMRVTPIAFPSDLTDDERAGASQLQAAMTHGHPTALAASELTMWAVRWALDGVPLPELPARLREHCHSQRENYRADWLGTLSQRAQQEPTVFIARGWDECLAVLDRLDSALVSPDPSGDPCRVTGEGWVAEEALATALLCVLLFPDDPIRALARAAASSGDSDSIAALAGAITGAAHGMPGWPADWVHRIEYADELARVVSDPFNT